MSYQENYEKIVTGLLFILVLSIVVIMCTSCISEPSKKDYAGRPDACYDAASCMYLNQKNQDKSVCLDAYKECRAYGRYNFCKEPNNRPVGVDFNGCTLYLNQK